MAMRTVAIVAAGAMGAAIAAVLTGRGLRVLTSLDGRSEASRRRAEAAGMIATDDAGLMQAEVILSIVPPSRVLALAERLAPVLAAAEARPVYVDCNAISPATVAAVEAVIAGTGADFVDGGIIGLPPRPGTGSPVLYVSGPAAGRVRFLDDHGQPVSVLAGAPVGAASALKLSYAGITKGLVALGSAMALAAERAGVADALRAELSRSQPQLLDRFGRSVPDMLPKAWRWVPEMHEIAGFVGDDLPEAGIYQALAAYFQRIADDAAARDILTSFYAPEDREP